MLSEEAAAVGVIAEQNNFMRLDGAYVSDGGGKGFAGDTHTMSVGDTDADTIAAEAGFFNSPTQGRKFNTANRLTGFGEGGDGESELLTDVDQFGLEFSFAFSRQCELEVGGAHLSCFA
jgi:hypothetical protein